MQPTTEMGAHVLLKLSLNMLKHWKFSICCLNWPNFQPTTAKPFNSGRLRKETLCDHTVAPTLGPKLSPCINQNALRTAGPLTYLESVDKCKSSSSKKTQVSAAKNQLIFVINRGSHFDSEGMAFRTHKSQFGSDFGRNVSKQYWHQPVCFNICNKNSLNNANTRRTECNASLLNTSFKVQKHTSK